MRNLKIQQRVRSLFVLLSMIVVGASFHAGTGGCGGGSFSAPAPKVISTTPPDGVTDQPVRTEVQVTFDMAMDAESINGDTIVVQNQSGDAVNGQITYDADTLAAKFTVTDRFDYNTAYSVIVSKEVKNDIGRNMDADYGYSFSTQPAILSMKLDENFADAGKFTVNIGHKLATVGGIAIQPDGKIVYSGYYGDVVGAKDAKLSVTRLDENGELDPHFGVGGIAWINCSSQQGLNWWTRQGLAIQSDGKIIAGGECNLKPTVFRLEADGDLDISFGVAGKVELPVLVNQMFGTVFNLSTQKIGSSENILIGGQWLSNAWKAYWLLARLGPTGTLDAGFAGGAGVLLQEWQVYDEGIITMAVLGDSSVIAYGDSIGASGLSDFAVAHYSSEGILDATFAEGDPAGIAGLAVINFDYNDWPYDMRVMTDGRIVGGVHVNDDGTGLNNDFGVFRLTPEGVPDTTFGSGGKVKVDFIYKPAIGNAIGLLPDGQMVLAGEGYNGTGIRGDPKNNDFAFVMLDASGNINTNFGDGGFMWTDFYSDDDAALLASLTNVVSDGSGVTISFDLLAAGFAVDPSDGSKKFAIAKYRSHIVEE